MIELMPREHLLEGIISTCRPYNLNKELCTVFYLLKLPSTTYSNNFVLIKISTIVS